MNDISEIKRISHNRSAIKGAVHSQSKGSNIIFKSFNKDQYEDNNQNKYGNVKEIQKRNVNSAMKESQSNIEMLNELRRDIDNILLSSIMNDDSNNVKTSHHT